MSTSRMPGNPYDVSSKPPSSRPGRRRNGSSILPQLASPRGGVLLSNASAEVHPSGPLIPTGTIEMRWKVSSELCRIYRGPLTSPVRLRAVSPGCRLRSICTLTISSLFTGGFATRYSYVKIPARVSALTTEDTLTPSRGLGAAHAKLAQLATTNGTPRRLQGLRIVSLVTVETHSGAWEVHPHSI